MREKLNTPPPPRGGDLEETLQNRGHLSQASKKEQMFPGKGQSTYESREEWKRSAGMGKGRLDQGARREVPAEACFL